MVGIMVMVGLIEVIILKIKVTKDIIVRLNTPGTTLISDSTTILSPGFF